MKALTRIGMILLFSVSGLGCSHLLYYPTRYLYIDATKLTPQPEERSFKIDSGLEVYGWYFRAGEPTKGTKAKPVVLFFHGNGQNRSAQFLTLYWLVREGFDLAIFDYPGYGKTEGSPSPESTVKMAAQAIRELAKMEPQKPLVVYGQSLGGAIAARAVWEVRGEVKPRLLVLDSTFMSYKKEVRKVMKRSAWTWVFQPLAWLLFSDEWAPGDRLKDLEGLPILFVHSKADELVPYEMGEDFFASAREPKELWSKEKGGHSQTYGDAEGKSLREKLVAKLNAI